MQPASSSELESYYTRQTLWQLFLIAALPIHLWAFLQFFADFAWIAERTNVWDSLAVGAYALLGALLESALVAVCAAGLGLLVSRKWDRETRLLLVGALAVLTGLWAMAAQYYFYASLEVPGWVYRLSLAFPRPLWMLTAIAGSAVGATVLPAAWLILRSGRVRSGLRSIVERLNLLMAIYLAVDAAAIVFILARNL